MSCQVLYTHPICPEQPPFSGQITIFIIDQFYCSVVTSYPTADIDEPRYSRQYYRGFYLIRDPQEWNRKGKVVPVRRMPPYLRSDDPAEEYYRVRRHRRAPKSFYMFHPTLTYPFMIRPRTREMVWGHWY